MKSNNSGGGLGVTSVLTIVFVVLKLTGVINWNWILVLSPFLIDLGIAIIIIVVWLLSKGGKE